MSAFADLLDHYCERIAAREPMTMYRFGDGERMLMAGQAVGEATQASRVDRWQAPAVLTRLGQDLRTVLHEGQGPSAHFGISCPCCDKTSYDFYDESIHDSETFTANLFINGNYGRWRAFLQTLKSPVAVVLNERASAAALPFEPVGVMLVPDDCVNRYESGRERYAAYARAFARSLPERSIVLVAAGPLSEALMFFMWNERPSHTYVDVGSSLDEMTYGVRTRPYMDPTSAYAHKQCYLPPPSMPKIDYSLRDGNVSRFFVREDDSTGSVIVDLPSTWWSRGFEYLWAQQFVEPDMVVLDAACGVSHPFKFWLASVCKRVFACDLDERIVNDRALMTEVAADLGATAADTLEQLNVLPALQRSIADLRSLPYRAGTFDRIFCISTLEHMTVEARAGALREFYRALRPGGVAVITMDVPPSPIELVDAALAAGFELLGPLDTRLPASALYSEHYRLHVFRVALRRPSHLAKESP